MKERFTPLFRLNRIFELLSLYTLTLCFGLSFCKVSAQTDFASPFLETDQLLSSKIKANSISIIDYSNSFRFLLFGLPERYYTLLNDGAPMSASFGFNDLSLELYDGYAKIKLINNAENYLSSQAVTGGAISVSHLPYSKKKIAKVKVFGGINEGGLVSNYSNCSGPIFFGAGFSYNPSNGYGLSSSFSDNSGKKGGNRQNSRKSLMSFDLKSGLEYDNAEIYASYRHVTAETGVPPNTLASQPIIYEDRKEKTDIISLNFKSYIGRDLNLSGNFFSEWKSATVNDYSETVRGRNTYIPLPGDYSDICYGATIRAEVNTFYYIPLNLAMLYRRESSERKNSELVRREVERLSISASQAINIADSVNSTVCASYNVLKPMVTEVNSGIDQLSDWNLYGDIKYIYSPDLDLSFSLNSAADFPRLYEIFPDKRYAGNSGLKPERINTIRAMINNKFDDLTFSASLFYNNISDKIFPNETNGLYTFENAGKTMTYGASINAFAHLSFIDIGIQGEYTGKKDELRLLSDYPDYTAKITIGSKYQNGTEWTAFSNIIGPSEPLGIDGKELGRINSYAVFGAKFDYSILEYLDIYCSLDNLADRNYFYFNGYPQAGFSFLIGVVYELK